MNKKICVYAICKNEIQFIDRWYNSVKEADYVCVLDTGSTDGSFEKLKSLGIITEQKKYIDFRFDIARNDSLKLIPQDTDICICVDIDEYFEPNWSYIIKANWNESIGRIRYRYTWNFNPDGTEGIVFYADKIHKYNHYKWVYPVHEILKQTDNKIFNTLTLPSIQLSHKADTSKSRKSYLNLLKLSVKEYPLDERNWHYLARELMFNKEYKKAITTFKKYLSMPNATWAEERSASERYIGLCYKALNIKSKQKEHLLKACLEAQSREALFELSLFYFEQKDYLNCAQTMLNMLNITTREYNYLSSPECWGYQPYDILSICFYYLKDIKKAILFCKTAISMSNEPRLKDNLNLYLSTKL